MLSDMSAHAWLTQEVEDLLTVGSVGLYELVAMLRKSEFNLGEHEIIDVASSVVGNVIARGQAQICLLRWPKDAIIDGPLPLSVLGETAAWDWLPSRLYFALMPSK
jgi:hypothetical protein